MKIQIHLTDVPEPEGKYLGEIEPERRRVSIRSRSPTTQTA
jgi:hypothetical protein